MPPPPPTRPPRPPTAGGSKSSASGSSFAAAAKVLFDSAQRIGAVKPLESNNKMYAHQLKKIQSQSKKRGGSLGGVSYKVAEFLATQRTPSSLMGPASKPNTRSTARKVPLLNITLPAAGAASGQPSTVAQQDVVKGVVSTKAQDDMTSLKIPSIFPPAAAATPAKQSVSHTASEKPDEGQLRRDDSVGTVIPPAVSAATEETDKEGATAATELPEVLITEDRPMFEVSTPRAEPPSAATAVVKPLEQAPPSSVRGASSVERAAPTAADSATSRKVPSLVIPSVVPPVSAAPEEAQHGTATADIASATTAQSYSVESWEQQREKEIARLQLKKQEEENRRLALLLEEEHRVLGEKWVEARTSVMAPPAPTSGEGKLSYSIASAASVEDALVQFQKLATSGARAAALLPTAAWSVTQKILSTPLIDRLECQDRFLELLEKSSIPGDIKNRIKLRFARGETLVTQYHDLDEMARKNLGRPQVKKLVYALVSNGNWEEAIQLVEASKTYLTDSDASLELTLANAARKLDPEPRTEVTQYVTRSVTASGRFEKEAKLQLALLESGVARFNALVQLAATPDADERVYGELIKRTSDEKLEALLQEVEKRGLSKDDPAIMSALVHRKLKTDSPMDVFAEIDSQAEKVGLQRFHVRAAVLAARMTPSTDVLSAAVKVAVKRPDGRSAGTLRTLLPFLYANEMYKEIGELVDVYTKYLPIARVLPEHVAFANEALMKLGREPLSSITVKECGLFVPESGATGGIGAVAGRKGHSVMETGVGETDTRRGSGALHLAGSAFGRGPAGAAAGTASTTASTGDLTAITEKMLSYAKEKQWAKALNVVGSLTDVPSEDLAGNSTAAALTLVYNCALSAAVEKPEVMLSVFSLMKERSVGINPTTVNTVLSSLSKSPQWENSVPFFEETTSQQRDMNTYLVMVSLLGKHGRWEEAVKAYDEMKKAYPKPPATMFTVAIGATANHSWADTLRIFQDMLKLHGASVKESVVNQVVRCLERNEKTDEVVKLEKEIQKKRKKKQK